jgi:transcriptional regulator of acetoin/glycerol metabolism
MGHSRLLRSAATFSEDAIPVLRPDGSIRTLAEIEDAMIDYALQSTGSPSRAADLLGIGRSTLYRRLPKKACGA